MFQLDYTSIVLILTRFFPDALIEEVAKKTGVCTRKRKIDVVALFWTLVLGTLSERVKSLAEARRAYEERTAQSIEESSFYDRFTPALSDMMKTLLAHSISELGKAAISKTQSCLYKLFMDVLLIDSTVIRLHNSLRGIWPGCRTNHSPAAVKIHARMGLRNSQLKDYKLSKGTKSDISTCRLVGNWVKNHLLLFDLGYYSYNLFSRIQSHGGYFITRLKMNSNPLIMSENTSVSGRSKDLEGSRIKDVLPSLKRKVIDVQIEANFHRRRYVFNGSKVQESFRLVGVFNESSGCYHLYLTNVPIGMLDAEQVAKIYKLRWQIELLFKELKSHYRQEQLPSRKKHIVEIFIYSSLLTYIASRAAFIEIKKLLPAERVVNMLKWGVVFSSHSGKVLESILESHYLRKVVIHKVPAERILIKQAMDQNFTRKSALACV